MNALQLLPTGRFEKLLLATDGSEFSAYATQMALHMGKVFNAQVRAINVVITNPEFEALAPKLMQQRETEARRLLNSVIEKGIQNGVACDIAVRSGVYPHDEILAEAEAWQADLIIMGRRGKRGLARMMVGDATARVVARAQCEVLVVPRETTYWQKNILLVTDGSRYSDRAAVVAGRLAKAGNLPLVVLTVVREGYGDQRNQEASQIVKRVQSFLEPEGIQVRTEVRVGNPFEVIVATAKELGSDLIVGGSHGRSASTIGQIFLGSVMERVIGLASCPVLTVKE